MRSYNKSIQQAINYIDIVWAYGLRNYFIRAVEVSENRKVGGTHLFGKLVNIFLTLNAGLKTYPSLQIEMFVRRLGIPHWKKSGFPIWILANKLSDVNKFHFVFSLISEQIVEHNPVIPTPFIEYEYVWMKHGLFYGITAIAGIAILFCLLCLKVIQYLKKHL